MGCNTSKVADEWARMKLHISRDEHLASLPYKALWERMFDHCSTKSESRHFYNVLLVVAIVFCFAIDTSICERGFSTMNLLKTARRSTMGDHLLRILMTICELGDLWAADPASIPVDAIIEGWRGNSAKGRYEGAAWDALRMPEDAPPSDAPAPAPT